MNPRAEAERAADEDPEDPEELEAEERAEEEVEDRLGIPGATPALKPDRTVIDEIVVKGQATTTALPDATSGIQMDASDLEDLGIQDVADLAAFVPNLEIRTAQATTSSFFIRGVGLQDFGANAAGAVAIYQDDRALNAPALQLAGLYDVETIGVLRGPQSWGAFRNASAGVIQINSRKPEPDANGFFRATLNSVVSNQARNAFGYELEGAINGAIVDDLAYTRWSFRHFSQDPFRLNRCGSNAPFNVEDERSCRFAPEGLKTYLNESQDWALRGQILIEPPIDDMTWHLVMQTSHLDRDSVVGEALGTRVSSTVKNLAGRTGGTVAYIDRDVNEEVLQAREEFGVSRTDATEIVSPRLADRPLDREPFQGAYNRTGKTTRDTFGVGLNGEFYIGDIGVATHTGYDQYKRFEDVDQDMTPNVLFERVANDEAWQLYQDVVLDGELDSVDLRWEAGGLYLMEDLDFDMTQFVAVTFDPSFNRSYQQKTWSFAFWGGFSLDFLDDFTLDAGVRYNWEKKSFAIEQDPILFPGSSKSSTTWDAPTWSASLTYRFSDEVSTYFKFSRGFKPGHYNSNAIDEAPANRELLNAYEWGVSFLNKFDGRLDFRGQLFYYDYQDYQVFLLLDSVRRPPNLTVLNANDAQIYGAEMELVLMPLIDFVPPEFEDLQIDLRGGWLESEFLDFVSQEERAVPTLAGFLPVLVDYTGNPLPSAPRWQFSGGMQWAFDMGRWGLIVPRYDFSWTDDVAFGPNAGKGSANILGEQVLPEFTTGQQAYILHNIRLAYKVEAGEWRNLSFGFEVAGWCRNFMDKRYKRYAADVSNFTGVILNFVGEPRKCGADLIVTF